MRAITLATATAMTLAAASVQAGGLPETVMTPETVAEGASSSSAGILVPILLVVILAAALSNTGGGGAGAPVIIK